MLDFRKWFLALAVVALIAIPASAQPLSCFAQATGTPSIRADGITELVGDILIKCDGGTPTAVTSPATYVPEVNIQIFTTNNINITSKIISSPFSESLLFIDEPVPGNQVLCGSARAPQFTGFPGECGILKTAGMVFPGTPYDNATSGRPNAYQGRQMTPNSLLWVIPFDPPGTTSSRYIRITNVRVNASQLNVPAGAQAAVGLFISTSPSGLGIGNILPISLPITNPAPTVAFAQQSMSFSVREITSLTFLQCVSANGGFAGDGTSAVTQQIALRYQELFQTAFKRRTLALAGTLGTPDYDTSPTPVDQNDFRTVASAASYNTETGFYIHNDLNAWFVSTYMPAQTTGLANSGTRLIARFNNMPNGVQLWVGVRGILVNTLATTQQTGNARLVTTDPNGAGPFSATPAGATVGAAGGIAQVSLVGNAGTAVWEILNTDSAATERVDFPVYIAYKANTTNNLPALGVATVNGSLAPLSNVMVASATAPVPRFVDLSTAANLAKINSCQTNLLYPYVTNRFGFDTGLVISNTTLDPFGTATQAGACKIYFYGDTLGGGAAPATQTTTTVPAGTQVVWALSVGGTNNVVATPGFQGYIIASCAFQMAHGFAFIDDVAAAKLAMGYLALVMDGSFGFRTGSLSEPLGM